MDLRVIVTAALLFACQVSYAAAPRAIITGPIDGFPGDFIDLSGTDSVASKWLWSVEPARFPDGRVTHRVTADGKTCQLASRPGIYRVQLIVSNEEGPAFSWHTVTIQGVAPNPQPLPPGPGPGPGPGPAPQPLPVPQPDIPPEKDKLGMATFSLAQAKSNPVDKTKLPLFAGNYASVASQIGAGAIQTKVAMNTALRTRNTEIAGTDRDKWANSLIVPLAQRMESLGLTTLDQWKQALEEIALGLYTAAK